MARYNKLIQASIALVAYQLIRLIPQELQKAAPRIKWPEQLLANFQVLLTVFHPLHSLIQVIKQLQAVQYHPFVIALILNTWHIQYISMQKYIKSLVYGENSALHTCLFNKRAI